MAYFFKLTQSGAGIVTSSESLTQTTETKTIGGVTTLVRKQVGSTGEVKFGFTAVDPAVAAQMNLQVGEELPLEITDKQVTNKAGEVVPNLYWAH